MALSSEKELELMRIYGIQSPQEVPDKEAALADIYGISIPAKQNIANGVKPQDGFLENVGKSKLGQSFSSLIDETGNIIKNIPNQNPTSSALQIFGQGAKAISTPIVEAISYATPQAVKEYVSDSVVGDVARQYARKWGEFSKENPEIAKDISAAFNVATTLPLGNAATAGIKQVQKPLAQAVEKIENIAQKSPGIIGKTESGIAVNAALGGIPNIASSIPKGIANRAKGMKALKPEQLDEIISSSHDATSAFYKAVDDTGATLRPQTAQKLNNDILSAIDTLQINPVASPKTLGAVKELYSRITVGKTHPITGTVTQAPLTVSELDGFRKLLNNISGEDAVVANKVRDTIDSALSSMTIKDFVGGGANAPKLLLEARANAAKTFKLEEIRDIISKAAGDPRAIKAGFKRFIDKKGWERGFNENEIRAIKEAAQYGKGELLERAIGTFGFDFGRTKNVALPAIAGGSSLAVPGGLPLVAVGTGARQTGKYAARGKAQRAFDEILKREGANEAAIPQDVFAPEILSTSAKSSPLTSSDVMRRMMKLSPEEQVLTLNRLNELEIAGTITKAQRDRRMALSEILKGK